MLEATTYAGITTKEGTGEKFYTENASHDLGTIEASNAEDQVFKKSKYSTQGENTFHQSVSTNIFQTTMDAKES